MQAVVGVFTSRRKAERAAREIRDAGLAKVTLLTPDESKKQVERDVVTDDMERQGIGTAVGGVVGAALGMAGGTELGVAAALLLPGVGPVLAISLGAAVLGAGGAAAGIAAGYALESTLADGVPKDDLFLYEDALRNGRSVIIAEAGSEAQADIARSKMNAAGAESLDAARHRWWMGLRPLEKEHYSGGGKDFDRDEDHFRCGFQAALNAELRGKPYEESIAQLQELFPEACNEFAFRRGYERGLDHYRKSKKSFPSRQS